MGAGSSTPRRKLHLVLSNFSQRKAKEFLVCESHRVLGQIYRSKGEREKAIHHLETALRIASNFNWHAELFWIHYNWHSCFLRRQVRRCASSHRTSQIAPDDGSYYLGLAMEMQARIWYQQSRLEEAQSEALRANEIYEKLGAAMDAGDCRELLQTIEKP
jgi:tetratricopeptide (TPR) repeat protein